MILEDHVDHVFPAFLEDLSLPVYLLDQHLVVQGVLGVLVVPSFHLCLFLSAHGLPSFLARLVAQLDLVTLVDLVVP